MGLCNAHYKRSRQGIAMDAPIQAKSKSPKGPCSAPGCTSGAKVLTFCRFHYHRYNRGADLAAPRHAARGEGFVNAAGYKRVTINGSTVFEHRAVMESCLGRLLLRSETVHHKNGDRLDNRLKPGHEVGGCPATCCNLELWSHSQPPGQRVADKVAWARELLRLYGAMFPEEPRAKPQQLRLLNG